MSHTNGRRFSINSYSRKPADSSADDHKPSQKHPDDNKKSLKRKYEENDNLSLRPAPAPPGEKERCEEAQSTPTTALTHTIAETIARDTAPSLPTLAELAAKKIVDTLLQGDDPIHDIASMERHEQSLLSPYLWREYKRLRSYQQDHKHSGERFFPEADRALFLHNGSKVSRPQDEISDNGGGENGYILRQRFIEQWEYSDNEDSTKGAYWDDDDLYREDSRLSSFCLCKCAEQQNKGRFHRNCKKHPHSKLRSLSRCISSPLLLYRLTAVFGMPPPTIGDQYKTCWEATLQWISDKESTIRFGEHKGGAYAVFRGSCNASDSALKLLDWLVSDNIPHAYDGILAGSVAREACKQTIPGVKAIHNTIPADQCHQLLSPQLWEEYRQLRDFEDKHKPSCNGYYFPCADKVLFMHDGSRIPDPTYPDSDDDDSYYAGRENGHDIRDTFVKQWAFYPDSRRSRSYAWRLEYERKQDGRSVASEEKNIAWNSDNLYRDDEKLQFQVHDCAESQIVQGSKCKKHPRDNCRPFHSFISSQLLYYRLAIIFEMPPTVETDENESCWEATLHKYGDDGSCIVFGERKGGAKVSFKGGLEASESALKLLDWLVSDNIPHNYDGVLCGTIA